MHPEAASTSSNSYESRNEEMHAKYPHESGVLADPTGWENVSEYVKANGRDAKADQLFVIAADESVAKVVDASAVEVYDELAENLRTSGGQAKYKVSKTLPFYEFN